MIIKGQDEEKSRISNIGTTVFKYETKEYFPRKELRR
jgi:hypothetical protein